MFWNAINKIYTNFHDHAYDTLDKLSYLIYKGKG